MSKSCDNSKDSESDREEESIGSESNSDIENESVNSEDLDKYDDEYEKDKDLIASLRSDFLDSDTAFAALRRIKMYGGLMKYIVERFEFIRDVPESEFRFRFNPRGFYDFDDYLWACFYREFTQLKLIDTIWPCIEVEDEKYTRHMNRLFVELQKDIEDRVMRKLTKITKSKK